MCNKRTIFIILNEMREHTLTIECGSLQPISSKISKLVKFTPFAYTIIPSKSELLTTSAIFFRPRVLQLQYLDFICCS